MILEELLNLNSMSGSINSNWQMFNILSYGFNTVMTFTIGQPSSFAEKLGLEDNRQVSERYPVMVTPAGYAFAIWGPIFVLEAGFTLYQCFVAPEHHENIQRYSPWWDLACLFQGFWSLAFGARWTGLSACLLSSIAICLNQVHILTVGDETLPLPLVTKFPFAMHFSWVVAASLINWNLFLKQKEVSSNIREKVGWLSVLFAFGFGLFTTISRQDPTIGFVSSWALVAISAKEKDPSKLDTSKENLEQFSKACKILGYIVCGVSFLIAVKINI